MKRAAIVERYRNRREPASLRSCLYTPFSSRHGLAVGGFKQFLTSHELYMSRARDLEILLPESPITCQANYGGN